MSVTFSHAKLILAKPFKRGWAMSSMAWVRSMPVMAKSGLRLAKASNIKPVPQPISSTRGAGGNGTWRAITSANT